jgi:hypothetical protein
VRGLAAAGLLLLSACAPPPLLPTPPPVSPAGERPTWERLVTSPDYQRILGADEAWASALAAARRAKHADELQALGPLAVQGAARPLPAPPEGDFRCRTIKLGSASPGLLDYIAYDWFRCRIAREGDGYALTKLTGSQRQVGRLYPDPARGWVFPGVLLVSRLPDEPSRLVSAHYGSNPENDTAGVFQKIGERHWRLVLPWPRRESQLDLVEFRPLTEDQ